MLVGAAFQPLRRAGGHRRGPGAGSLVAPGESFDTGGFPHLDPKAPQGQPPAKGNCAGAPAVLGAVWGAWRARGAAAGPAGRPAGEPREPGSGPGRRRGAGRPGPGGKGGFARRKKHRWRRRSAIPGREQAASSPVLTAVRPPPLNTRMRRPSARRGAGKREAEEAEAEAEREPETEPEPEAGAETDRPADRPADRRGWATHARPSESSRDPSQVPASRGPGLAGESGAPEQIPSKAFLGLHRGLALLKAPPSTAGPDRPP